jgi:hypothetical protein
MIMPPTADMLKRLLVGFLTVAGWAMTPAIAQNPFDNFQKGRARQMLKDLADGMRKHYYDPSYHGVDLESRVKTADDLIRNASTLGQAFAVIAEVLDTLNDSHTFFVPPARSVRREYGYEEQMVGDHCLVTAVRPNSSASEKLTPGDEVRVWEGFTPARDSLWKMTYMFNTLVSLPVQHLVVRSPGGAERKVEITAREHQEKRVLDLTGGNGDLWQLLRDQENSEHLARQRISEFGDKLMVWKLPEFEISEEEIDRILKQARKYTFLVLDLRGNPGGLIKSLQFLVSGVMDHDVTIAKRTGRRPDLKPISAKARGTFTGKLIVLIDSRSASAAELFARVVQLEHRGTVLGDHSSGSVMESIYYPWHQGVDTQFYYGASITEADLVMNDGKSLEHTGVIPDELILPTPEDLERGRDPVLSRAAKLAGIDLDPVASGRIFPVEWKKD